MEGTTVTKWMGISDPNKQRTIVVDIAGRMHEYLLLQLGLLDTDFCQKLTLEYLPFQSYFEICNPS